MSTNRLIAKRFDLGELIGQGSMGEVFRGLDTQTGAPVAIKALKQSVVHNEPEIAERFEREGEALRRLSHPSIVEVLLSTIEEGRHYIVMEYVGGGSLDRLLQQQRQLPIARVLEIGIDLSDALIRAHRLHIIHRDIKPQNVLLAEDDTPRLTDFGVAHIGDLSSITQSGALVGTLPYLSPEAWRFDEPDERTDIWAFGVMLYEMLAGRRPFLGDQVSKIKDAILRQPLPDLRLFRPDAPAPLVDLIARMLEKDRERRYGSMREIGVDLERIVRSISPSAVAVAPVADMHMPEPEPAALAVSEVDLTVTRTGMGYTVRLRSGLGGGDSRTQAFNLPFDLAALPRRRHDVADWVKQARIRRLRANEELKLAREFGATLFERLFSGAVLDGFRASRAALPAGERLRLRLRLAPDLAPIPWELLYDPHDEQFLALTHDLALLRYPEPPAPLAPLKVDGPLHVVVVLASPAGADYPPIRLDRELHRIESVLKTARAQGRIALDVIRGHGTLDQLRARLRSPMHVLHVLCHGDMDEARGGVLIFEDADGAAEPIGADHLRGLLQRRPPRLVLLNACLGATPADQDPFSSVGAALLRGGVPAVIAMQFELAEDAAVELARVFYAELAAGAPVDLALTEARLHLYGRYPQQLDWAIPVLFLRAETGALFELAAPIAQPSHTTSPPAPAPRTPTPHEIIVELKTLRRLWHLALTACTLNEWERAADLLQQVADVNPNYEDVQARIAQARKMLALPSLYRQALAQRADDQWQAALEKLDALEREQPGYPDVEGVRAWAERRGRREQRFAAARAAHERADWAAAIAALEALLAEQPDDAEARALLKRVGEEHQAASARERQLRSDPGWQRHLPRHTGSRSLRDPRARYGTPLAHIEAGEFADALDMLEDLLAQQADNRAAELVASLIERTDVPLRLRLRAAHLAGQAEDRRPGVFELEPAWRFFPAGRYIIGALPDPSAPAAPNPQRVTLEDFQIARYPVTVRQFLRFWEDRDGYENQRWWTPQGWAWKQAHGVAQPYRWGDRDWMALNQPVSGIAWYEAVAFCNWLTQRRRDARWLRGGQFIRLPSEAEWEVAATWDPRTRQPRLWRPPAGAIWQNVVEAGIGRASPVGLFAEGISPSGMADMAGNLWEWCASRYANYAQEATRLQIDFASNVEGPVVRGGAYNVRDALAGWGARNWYFPNLHQHFTGFRVVLASKGFWNRA
jgi:formylglycine-generating enzyme required for sulfatase activity